MKTLVVALASGLPVQPQKVSRGPLWFRYLRAVIHSYGMEKGIYYIESQGNVSNCPLLRH
jgi:hypothetical protein